MTVGITVLLKSIQIFTATISEVNYFYAFLTAVYPTPSENPVIKHL